MPRLRLFVHAANPSCLGWHSYTGSCALDDSHGLSSTLFALAQRITSNFHLNEPRSCIQLDKIDVFSEEAPDDGVMRAENERASNSVDAIGR